MKVATPGNLLRLVLVLIVSAALAGPSFAGLDTRSAATHNTREGIIEAQAMLVDLGYLAAGSYQKGVRDEATSKAIEAFQQAHAMARTGQLDFDTFAQLTTHEPGTEVVAQAPVKPAPAPKPVQTPAPVAVDTTPKPTEPVVAQAETPKPVVTPAPAPAPMVAERTMPETDAPIGLLAGLSGLLLAAGVVLLYLRRF